MKKHLPKRLLSLLLALVLCVGLVVPAAAAESEENAQPQVSFEKVDNSEVTAVLEREQKQELTQAPVPEEPAYQDTDMVRVSIVLYGKSTLECGYSTDGIADNDRAMAYRSALEQKQETVETSLAAMLGELDVVWNLTLAANIISANVQYGQIAAIESHPSVKEVVIETCYAPAVVDDDLGADPNMATSGTMIGRAEAYAAGYNGAGSRIAIIDTGTDTDHKSFDADAFEYALADDGGTYDLLDVEEIDSVLDKLNATKRYAGLTAEDLYLNSKLAFAFNYVDKNLNVTHDFDSQTEHGSHVAGIATANRYVENGAGEFVSALEEVNTQGVAPDAQLITMKVFGVNGGAYDSDYMVAIEDAIVLGCDAINLSLGSSSAGFATNTEYTDILNRLCESDAVVVMSAGNSSSWSSETAGIGYLYGDDVNQNTVGSPGSYTNSLAVASVDNTGFTGEYLTVGDSNIFYTQTTGYSNEPMSSLAGEQEYILIDGNGTEADWATVGDALKGKIAVCSRGTISFYEKAEYAVAAGAIATIIYNNTSGTISMDLSDYTLTEPCVSVTQYDGAVLKANATPVTDGKGNVLYYKGILTVSNGIGSVLYDNEYYTMSSFSSWGVPGDLSLKPEITAPGGNIYSVNGQIPGGESYENMSGTSMAAPQVTGMMALLAQYIKENGLRQEGLTVRALAQSLLMSTAEPMRDGESGGEYYPVLQQGAGLANVGNAISADSYILMGADATKSYADGKVKAELGDDPARTGTYSFSFSVNNLTDEEQCYTLSADLFTQDLFSYGGQLYLDTWTTGLDCTTVWTVNGVTLKPDASLAKLDFNGDGEVNGEDCTALLDYVTGERASITNEDLAAALDGEDGVSTRDAYIFLSKMNEGAVSVPANGSVQVQVTLTLTDAQKAYLDANYANGAYVEGYVYVTGLTTTEGVLGSVHSIPVLAFYGNWSDASMYEPETLLDYWFGTYEVNPYTYSGSSYNKFTNYIGVKYPGVNEDAFLGSPLEGVTLSDGTPLWADQYLEERNAINSDTVLTKMYYTSIRNAAAGKLTVTDDDTGEVYFRSDFSQVYGAYYHSNAGVWRNLNLGATLNWSPEDLEDGTRVNVTLTLAPEYYVQADGSVSWDALGDGASMSIGFTVDNEEPTVTAVYEDLMNNPGSIVIEAEDNNYIAGVLLYAMDGREFYDGQLIDQTVAGEPISAEFDADLEDDVYLIQVWDYAGNIGTYRLFYNVKPTDTVESIEVTPETLTMMKGTTASLDALVLPVYVTDSSVTWTSSDEKVATVNANGLVTAVGEGECKITATSNLDKASSASCLVTVRTVKATIYGALQDVDGNPLLFSWNMETDPTWTAYAKLETDLSSVAWDWFDKEMPLYQQNSSGMMYKVDVESGETLDQSETTVEFGAPMQDMDFAFYTYMVQESPLVFGIYENYFVYSMDPLDNTFTTGYDWSDYFSYTGASKFVALAWGGTAQYGGTVYDIMCALDDAGYLWYLWINSNTGSLERLGFDATDLNLPFPTNQGYQFCSMVFDDKLEVLYLSYFTGDTNEIYMLEYNEAAEIYESTLIGDVGDGVWPTALFQVAINESAEEESGDGADRSAQINIFANEMMAVELEPEEVKTEKQTAVPKGSLNSTVVFSEESGSSKTRSSSLVNPSEGILTVELTAKNAAGRDVASNNGLMTVTYDSEALTLVDVRSHVKYDSAVVEDGSVTFAYAQLETVPAGASVATLIFQVRNIPTGSIRVEHRETDTDLHVGKTETLWPQVDWDGDGDADPVLPLLPIISGGSSMEKPTEAMDFTDVSKSDPFYDAVKYVYEEGLMNGTGNGKFSPYGTLTRAMVVTILYRIEGEPATRYNGMFRDVANYQWYTDAVEWAAKNNIVTGYTSGKFGPEDPVTREQLAAILYRYALSKGSVLPAGNSLTAYADGSNVSSYAVSAVKWAVAEGILEAQSGKLQPRDAANRAQVAIAVAAFHQKYVK